MINTWTKDFLGKTILCVQTQKKGWWWQRSTIFLSILLLPFFSVDDCKKGKKKKHPKRLIINRFFSSVKYHSYDTKQYFGKQNEMQPMKKEYCKKPFLLSDTIRYQEEKWRVCALCGKQNEAKNVSLVEELHQLSFTK